MNIKKYDVVVVGGSIGGVLASLSLLKSNLKVALTEETAWIGGQLTNQAVPSDEHKWIEEFGCTRTYREFRNKIREHYKNHPHFKEEVSSKPNFNPGGGWVSRITAEPKVAHKIFEEMISEYLKSGQLELFLETKAISAEVVDDEVQSVVIQNNKTAEKLTLIGKFFLDATDVGSLLPLTNTEYVTGAESKAETNEPHAKEVACPLDMQPVTWVAAVEFAKGENHVIEKPKMYDYFNSHKVDIGCDYKALSWEYPLSKDGGMRRASLFGHDGAHFFNYRKIINSDYFLNGFNKNDVTLLNWPQNDYTFGNIYESEDAKEHLEMARELTLSVIYWLQTEAPREGGKFGYPEIKLRGDVVGTNDGLAMAPYIRESRRIKALHTIKEQDISLNKNKVLPRVYDSVGIGSYHIDIHMTTVSKTFFFEHCLPFEIPLGSLIPIKTKNLLPACKNIGTTHITNGCFRLHPVEWNVGEVAGYFAAYCLRLNMNPQEVYKDQDLIKSFQAKLIQAGIELSWPENVLEL
ncbi:MAG: FAD-dependent oxidoreductase [Bacilli bacterium]